VAVRYDLAIALLLFYHRLDVSMMTAEDVRITIALDPINRERLRAICHEYQCSIAHAFRQLICAEFRQLFPDEVEPKPRPLRRLDRDRGPKRALYSRSAIQSTGILAPGAPPAPRPADSATLPAPTGSGDDGGGDDDS